MKKLSCGLIPALIVAGMPFPAFAASAPKVTHETLACIPTASASQNARIYTTITSDSPITSVRVYFRSANHPGEYYLEMRRGEGGAYWATLPLPEKETDKAVYRIVARDGNGMETSSEPATVSSTQTCPGTMTTEEQKYAKNLVIGLTQDNQKAVPPGWKCEGIVSKITTTGEMKPHEECRQVIAAAAAKPGISPLVYVAAGAAAVAGGIVIATSGGGDKAPVSPARPAPQK